MLFKNREEAGRWLAEKLDKMSLCDGNAVVLGLPRGGVVVAAGIAKALKLPLDVCVAKKINPPGSPEFAIGAIAEEGDPFISKDFENLYDSKFLEEEIKKKRELIKEYVKKFRGKNIPLDLKEKTVILVDDGIATGQTMLAAINSVRRREAKKVVVATPVVPPDTVEVVAEAADELYYINAPAEFYAICQFYQNFSQLTEEEVKKILREFRKAK